MNSNNNNDTNDDEVDNNGIDDDEVDNNGIDDDDVDINKKRKLKDISLFTIPTSTTKIADFSLNNNSNSNTDTYTTTDIDKLEWYHNIESMTKGNLRNKNLKTVEGVKIHNYWDNIFRRKFKMHDYFSESAFGSEADKLIEHRNIWEDPEFKKKYANNKKKKEKRKKKKEKRK